MLADSLLTLKCLGLYEDNDFKGNGNEYGKCIFNNNVQAICNADISQNVNKEFKIEVLKYHTDKRDLNGFPSQIVDKHSKDPNFLSLKCTLTQQR